MKLLTLNELIQGETVMKKKQMKTRSSKSGKPVLIKSIGCAACWAARYIPLTGACWPGPGLNYAL